MAVQQVKIVPGEIVKIVPGEIDAVQACRRVVIGAERCDQLVPGLYLVAFSSARPIDTARTGSGASIGFGPSGSGSVGQAAVTRVRFGRRVVTVGLWLALVPAMS